MEKRLKKRGKKGIIKEKREKEGKELNSANLVYPPSTQCQARVTKLKFTLKGSFIEFITFTFRDDS